MLSGKLFLLQSGYLYICVFLCFFCVVFCCSTCLKKMDIGVDGWGLANPTFFSDFLYFFLT